MRTLMMVAKQPVPGRCKTRLCPPLQPAEAAELYQAFLTDLMQRLAHLAGAGPTAGCMAGPTGGLAGGIAGGLSGGLACGVAYTPESDPAYFQQHAPAVLEHMVQQGGDFGERLDSIARRCLERGDEQVVIMSSDSPNLPSDLLLSAFDRLRTADVVLGPAEDGGYYLIGLRAYTPQVFQNITWSTEVVLAQTLERAHAAGLVTALLPPWYDVDTVADLHRLAEDVLSDSGAKANPATAAALARWVVRR